MENDRTVVGCSFFLTSRNDAPQVPDFDGRGPRACTVADVWASSLGREFWLADAEPSIRSLGGSRSQVALACRHGGASLSEVFDGSLVRVHVVLVGSWGRFKEWIEDGSASSEYWGEIVEARSSIPDVIQ